MILVKIHESGNSYIICLCDSNLIGKKFAEGNLCLNVSERFYKGREITERDITLIKKGVNLNVVGEESIKLTSMYRKINKIIKIENIPHAIVV